MKVLILFRWSIDPRDGGVERVYHNLSKEFVAMGIETFAHYHLSSDYDKNSSYTKLFLSPYDEKSKKQIRDEVLKIIKDNDIQHVIMPYQMATFFYVCKYVADISHVYIHIHNQPDKLFDYTISLLKKLRFPHTFSYRISNFYHSRFLYGSCLKKLTDKGAKVILLSESFRDCLRKTVDISDSCVISLPNPFLIDKSLNTEEIVNKKEKILLYVGRLSEKQKRVSSLLKIWGMLQDKLPDYRLEIVGDGPSRKDMEEFASKNHLEHVKFYGFQDPTPFYKKASILLQTSNYEGFSMVLVEAMSFGAIPFVFDSYPSIKDVLDDGINGYSITPFDERSFSEKVLSFIQLPISLQNKMRYDCIQKASTFDVKIIANKWTDIFRNQERI